MDDAQSRPELTAVVTMEGEWFVARCPELDLACRRRTIESALHDLHEAVRRHLGDRPGGGGARGAEPR